MPLHLKPLVNPFAKNVERTIHQETFTLRAINKHSSKGQTQKRWVANTSSFLLQLKPSGTVTRMVPLNEIQALERDGTRLALRTTFPTSQERDWLWEWEDHLDNNPHLDDKWLEIINFFRGHLVDGPPLTWLPLKDPKSLRLEPNDGITVTQRLAMYDAAVKRGQSAVPRPKPPQPSATAQTRDLGRTLGTTVNGNIRTVHMIQLHDLDEPLGIDYMHRIEAEMGNGGVFVTKVMEGSPAARAGVSMGRILTVAERPIETSADLHEAVRQVKAKRQLQFPIELCVDEDASNELANLGFTHTPSVADRVPVVYTVTLSSPDEPLGLEYMGTGWSDGGEPSVRVKAVTPGGACDRAGLPLAPIAAIDGAPVQSVDDLARAVGIARSQQRYTLQMMMLVPATELTTLGQDNTMSADGTFNRRTDATFNTPGGGKTDGTFVRTFTSPGEMQRLAQVAEGEVNDGASVSSDPGGVPADPEEMFARKLHELTKRKQRGEVTAEEYARSKQRLMKMLANGDEPLKKTPPQRTVPPSSRACVNINRYVFLRQGPSRGSFWIPGGGVHGELEVQECEGEFALVQSRSGKRGWVRTHYLRWLPPGEATPPRGKPKDSHTREILETMRGLDPSRSPSPRFDDARSGPSYGRSSPHEYVTFEGLGQSSPSRYPRLSAWVREEQLAQPVLRSVAERPGPRDFSKLV